MERVSKHIIGLVSLLISSAAFAGLTNIDEWGVKPNIGFDVGVKHQSFSQGFGEEQFREDYPETNLYIGAKFHSMFGMEVGYQHIYRQQRQQFYNEFASVLGFFDMAGSANRRLYISDVFGQAWNFNLQGYWPICPRTKTELMGSIGIAWQKLYYSTTAIANNNAAEPIAVWESDNRAMLKLGVGIRQMITKHFGSRLQLFWEDTSKLGATFAVPTGQGGLNAPFLSTHSYTVRPKDSYSVLLGFFFQIT